MPFDPDVRPWSGVSAVSPSTYLILSTPIPSSAGNLAHGDAKALPKIDLPAKQRHGAVAVHGEKGVQLIRIEYPRPRRRARGAGLQPGQGEAHGENTGFEH